MVIGINTDILFPLVEQQVISQAIPSSRFEVVDSSHGHDGFLIETLQFNKLINSFLQWVERLEFLDLDA